MFSLFRKNSPTKLCKHYSDVTKLNSDRTLEHIRNQRATLAKSKDRLTHLLGKLEQMDNELQQEEQAVENKLLTSRENQLTPRR